MNENVRLGIIVVVLVAIGAGIWFLLSDPPEQEVASQTSITMAPSEPKPETAQQEPQFEPDEPAPDIATTPEATPSEEAEAKPETGEFSLEVTLVDMSGSPVPGVEILAERIDWARNKEQPDYHVRMVGDSDASGTFKFTDLIEGLYAVRAATPTSGQSDTLRLSDSRPEGTLRLEMQAGAPMAGIVQDSTSTPIAGAVIHLYETEHFPGEILTTTRSTSARVFSDAQGRFLFTSLWLGTWKFYAKAEGYAGTITDFYQAGDENIRITLGEGATVSGVATIGKDGDPVPDLPVWLSTSFARDAFKAETNAEGQFQIPNVRPGEYKVMAMNDTYVLDGDPVDVSIHTDEDHDDVKLALTSGARINGHLVDATTDRGIAGAKIRSRHPISGGASIDITTGRDGAFEMTGLTKGTYRIEPNVIEGLGWESKSKAMRQIAVIPGEFYEVVLKVELGLAIRGQVIDLQGEPLEEVRVRGNVSDRNYHYYTDSQTDANGRFMLAGFRPGSTVQLLANKGTYATESPNQQIIEATDVNGVTITMINGAVVSGEVVDQNGNPMSDAHVRLTSVEDEQQMAGGSVTSSGTFTANGILPGKYKLDVYTRMVTEPLKDNFNETLDLASGDQRSGLRIVVQNDRETDDEIIRGRVTDVSGNPIERASITGWDHYSGNSLSARTSAQGKYTLRGLKKGQSYTLSVYKAQYTSQGRHIPAGDKDADFVLEGVGAIAGTVVDGRTGAPLEQFEAMVRNQDGPVEGHEEQNFRIFANAEGHFQFTDQAVGSRGIFARAEGYAPGFEAATIRAEETTDNIIVRLFKGATIQGTVVAEDGSPVLGALIFAGELPDENRRERASIARTDLSGNFHIDSLSASTTEISAWHQDYLVGSTTLSLREGGDTNTQIVLRQGGTIEGLVFQGQEPVANAYLNIGLEGINQPRKNITTDENGRYRATGIPEGFVFVQAQLPYTGSQQQIPTTIREVVEIESGSHSTVDFTFQSTNAGIEGLVTFRGQPAESGSIELIFEAENGQRQRSFTRLNEDGYYVLEGQPNGLGTINVQGQKGEMNSNYTAEVNLVDGEIVRVNVELASDHQIVGTVHGSTADRVVQIAVYLEGSLAPGTRVMTTADFVDMRETRPLGSVLMVPDGSFTMMNIRPGRYALMAVELPSQPDESSQFRTTVVNIEVTEAELETRVDISF